MFTEFMEQRGPGHTAGGKNFYIKGYGDYKKEIAQAIKILTTSMIRKLMTKSRSFALWISAAMLSLS